MPDQIDLIIIGGTGLYQLVELIDSESLDFDTPFGPGSAPFQIGTWHNKRVAFLARHGKDHRLAPHEINYKSNILACSELAPTAVIAINAVGSMNRQMPPTALVLPDQIIDYTWGREHTFSGNFDDERGEQPLHIDFSEPYSPSVRELLIAADRNNALVATTGAYGVTQGPRLETAAEIKRMQRDGCDLVGMTGMPEAALARELELEFASICLVANWAAGFNTTTAIRMSDIMRNIEQAKQTLVTLLDSFLRR